MSDNFVSGYGDRDRVSIRDPCGVNNDQPYHTLDDASKFKLQVSSVLRDITRILPGWNAPVVNRTSLCNGVDALDMAKIKYFNVTAYVLGYLTLTESKVDGNKVEYIFDNILGSIKDTSVQQEDVIRYARFHASSV